MASRAACEGNRSPEQIPTLPVIAAAGRGAFWLSILVVAVLGAGLMMIIGSHDRALARVLAAPGGALGQLVEELGKWPAYAAAFLSAFFLLFLRRLKGLAALYPYCVSAVFFFIIHPLGITGLLKALMRRARPRLVEMIPRTYTPFFRRGVIPWADSFPSGHVAASSIFLLVPLQLWGTSTGKSFSLLSWIGCTGYPVVVAVGRVVEKRHFMSDVIFSLILGLIVSAIAVRVASWQRRSSEAASTGEEPR